MNVHVITVAVDMHCILIIIIIIFFFGIKACVKQTKNKKQIKNKIIERIRLASMAIVEVPREERRTHH